MSEQSSLSPLPSDTGDTYPLEILNRSQIACIRCNKHKVGCSRPSEPNTKCKRCQDAKEPVECVFPVRDRKVSVQERQELIRHLQTGKLIDLMLFSFLKNILDENKALKRALKRKRSVDQELPLSTAAPSFRSEDVTTPISHNSVQIGCNKPLQGGELRYVPDETPIQPCYVGEAACTTFGKRLQQHLSGRENSPLPSIYPHYKHINLLRISTNECKLPSRNYAQLLIRTALRFIGPDYHLIPKKSILERLDETYQMNVYDDPIWLCQLFIIFSLGELYSPQTVREQGAPGVPGTAYFLKAMELFQDLHEEPTISYIETLLLISFYSTALNRKNSAYAYSGLALRLSLTLGLHRKLPGDRGMPAHEREHRNRVWWTAYVLDRVCSSKVGLPVMFRDEDADVPLPSMDGLSDLEKENFYDPTHINAQIKLAKITGNILNEIYHIPQPGKANTFVQGVHTILTSLRGWNEELPPLLKFNLHAISMYSSRSVVSLHLNFSQCVMLTTRPIFFHKFRSCFPIASSEQANAARSESALTEELAEACVKAARTSSAILAQVWVDGNLATFGFFDALSIFSSTLTLMMSTVINANQCDCDAVETSMIILKSMQDAGSVPATDYYTQLVQIKVDLDEARGQLKDRTKLNHWPLAENSDSRMLGAGELFNGNTAARTKSAINEAIVREGAGFGMSGNLDSGAALDSLKDFLAQEQPLGSSNFAEPMGTFSRGGSAGQYLFDWWNANMYPYEDS